MALTKLIANVMNHSAQDDEPNDVGLLSAPALKAIFDKAAVDIKAYNNDVLTVELDATLALKETIAGLTANRKLSPTGDFTGTLGGYPIVYDQTGLATTVSGHTEQLTETETVTSYGFIVGGSDNKTALQNAIIGGMGKVLKFKAGSYELNGPINVTATGDVTWESDGPVSIKYTGATTANDIITILLASHNINIKGDFVLDVNTKSKGGLFISNIAGADMTSAVDCYIDRLKVINCYSVTVGSAAYGIRVYGAFNTVKMDGCSATNINRAVGVGIPSEQGSHGISVISDGTINHYIRNVIITDPILDNITSEEADASSDNADCDGLHILGPSASANGGLKLATSLIVRGGKYINCRGRSIKSQMEMNTIITPEFIRDSVKSIPGGVEVDIQRGSGVIRNVKCRYKALPGNTTPFGTGFKIIGAQNNNLNGSEGVIIVDGVEIINDVDPLVGTLGSLLSIDATLGTFNSITVKNITSLGLGKLDGLVYGNLTGLRSLNIDNALVYNLGYNLVYSYSAMPNLKATITNCQSILATNVYLLRASTAGMALPKLTAYGNTGFATWLESDNSISPYMDECLRVNKMGFKNSTTGGVIAGESFLLVNETQQDFKKRGMDGNCIYIVSTSGTQLTQGIFAHNGTVLDLCSGLSTSIAYGSGTSPNVAGKLNVWMDVPNKKIYIKNKLGFDATVTLTSIG